MKITIAKILFKTAAVFTILARQVSLFVWPLMVAGRMQPVICYGNLVTPRSKYLHGGKVKIRHLLEWFPENRTANILYLVSSALPTGYRTLIKQARKKGIKIVWNQNGVGYKAWAGNNFAPINLSLASLHKADHVIYQSEFCKRSADLFLGQFGGTSSIIYNCVDHNQFTPAPQPPSIKTPCLLIMGTHNAPYRVLYALDVLVALRAKGVWFKLIIGGSISWHKGKEEIKSEISKRGLETCVKLYGPYEQKEAPEIFRSAHILLHLQYNDASPTVPLEAMACGLPVVASGSGGCPEILGTDGGLAIPLPEDYEKIHIPDIYLVVKAITQIHSDWQTWSQSARERAMTKFSKEQWLDVHANLFTGLISCH